jgi:S-(hydroxymethyl)mycothiol dehydrogenase
MTLRTARRCRRPRPRAFAEKTLVGEGACVKVDERADPAAAGLLGCGVMAGWGAR